MELLVVIGIIGILAGVLLATFGGATESARLAKCQSNLKNLAAAVNSSAMESGHYPYAGSAQYMSPEISDNGDILIKVHKGWVSWLDKGQFKGKVTTEKSIAQSSYVGSDEDVTHALTNGAIWRAVGRNRAVYQCPVHQKSCLSVAGKQPGWSYAMNAYFGYERQKGKASTTEDEAVSLNGLSRADRRLLFAEIQGLDNGKINVAKYKGSKLPDLKVSAGAGNAATDGILQYKPADGGAVVGGNGATAESMGFNHIRGNRIVGLVAFADGHTEALILPKNGNFEELTGWLCEGYDITFSSDQYDRINDTDVN